jgi:predicted ATPase
LGQLKDQLRNARRKLAGKGFQTVPEVARQYFEDEMAKGRTLDEWLARDYRALGYRVARVPALAPEERLRFVLERLSEQG